MRGAALLIVAIVAVGCSGAANEPSVTAATSAPAAGAADGGDRGPPTPAPLVAPSPSPSGSASTGASSRAGGTAGSVEAAQAPQQTVAAAVDDLADRLDVTPSAIAVQLAEVVSWPDNSIGCPIRDRQYLEGPVQGARVHLSVDGTLYRYHAGGQRSEPFLCEISLKSEVPIRRLEP